MEFDDLKKIWDTQNNKPMYAIDEKTLQKRIRAKGGLAKRKASINEIGLMIICVATGSFILSNAVIQEKDIYSYLLAFTMYLIGGYVFWGRIQRKKLDNRYDLSILEELDQAIANANYLVKFAKSMVWWFILPAASVVILKMTQATYVPVWKWIVLPASFVLSYIVVHLGIKQSHLPRLRELETLRDNLNEQED